VATSIRINLESIFCRILTLKRDEFFAVVKNKNKNKLGYLINMLYYENNQWNFCELKMIYDEYGVQTYKCIHDKKWWLQFSEEWAHINNLSFVYMTPTLRQINRLDIVNNEKIPEGFMSETIEFVFNGRILNPDNLWFANITEDPDLDTFKEELYEKIENERVNRTQLMPWTIPSTGVSVQVKIGEDAPGKPRMSWLSGNSAWGIMEVQDGNPDVTDTLIAADDTLHTMTASEWKEFGRAMKYWIGDNVIAAKQHLNAVKNLTNLQDILDYDYLTGWPE